MIKINKILQKSKKNGTGKLDLVPVKMSCPLESNFSPISVKQTNQTSTRWVIVVIKKPTHVFNKPALGTSLIAANAQAIPLIIFGSWHKGVLITMGFLWSDKLCLGAKSDL